MIDGSQVDVSYSWLPPEAQRDGCVLLRLRTFAGTFDMPDHLGYKKSRRAFISQFNQQVLLSGPHTDIKPVTQEDEGAV